MSDPPNRNEIDADGPVRVLVVEHERTVRAALTRLLVSGGFACAAVPDARAARRALASARYMLVMCDVDASDSHGLDLLREIAIEFPGTATVAVAGLDDSRVAREAMELGAYGYVVKPFRPNEVLVNVTNVLKRVELESKVATAPLGRLSVVNRPGRCGVPPTNLTKRELEILGLLAQGLSNAALAERLSITPNTVRNHVQRILEKLGAHSKLEAVTTSLRAGVVKVPVTY